MTKKIFSIVLPLFMLIFCASIFAVENGGDKQKQKAATLANEGQVYKIDITAKKLTPNFSGTDIVKLFSILVKKAPLRKGEFESTIDYEQKIERVITPDIYAFKLDLTSDKFADSKDRFGLSGYAKYDPDLQKLKINIDNQNYRDYRTQIIVKEVKHPSSSYIGGNAFGATCLVKRVRATQYIISFDDTVGVSNLELIIPRARAKKLKNNIGVLCLCKTSLHEAVPNRDLSYSGNALIFENEFYVAPTIDNQMSILYYRKYINVDLLDIWLYNIRSGEILLKEKMNDKSE